MEGAEPDGIGLGPDEVLDTLFHFLGGLIGKGNGQDAVRRDAELQEVGDAAGQNLGLPRSGAGSDQERALCMIYGLTLAVVQGVENRIHKNSFSLQIKGPHQMVRASHKIISYFIADRIGGMTCFLRLMTLGR